PISASNLPGEKPSLSLDGFAGRFNRDKRRPHGRHDKRRRIHATSEFDDVQADKSDEDQINGDDEIEQSGNDQDENAGDDRDDRLKLRNGDGHSGRLLGLRWNKTPNIYPGSDRHRTCENGRIYLDSRAATRSASRLIERPLFLKGAIMPRLSAPTQMIFLIS